MRANTATVLAERCIATFSADQIFHGIRPGGPCAARSNAPPCNPLPEDLAVFNASNPTSMRHSNLQAAMDLVQQASIVTHGLLGVSATTSYSGTPITFDPSKLMLRAHSMGAGSGVLALAVDDQFTGTVLSGSAAMVILSLLSRTQPQDLADLLVTERE